jgi:hypothetical protein
MFSQEKTYGIGRRKLNLNILILLKREQKMKRRLSHNMWKKTWE